MGANPIGLSFVSGQSNRGGYIQLIDTLGDTLQNLTFLTLPSKCAFAMASSSVPVASSSPAVASSTSSSFIALYCGVPRDQSGLGYYFLPDDYEQGTIFTSDDLYQVNTATGHIDTIWGDSSENFDITDVDVSSGMLFFVNRYDQRLYAVTL